MIGQQVDYTRMRKGSKPNCRPIVVCPKCGRKGEIYAFPGRPRMGQKAHAEITHRETIEIEPLFGFPIHSDQEQCRLSYEEALTVAPSAYVEHCRQAEERWRREDEEWKAKKR